MRTRIVSEHRGNDDYPEDIFGTVAGDFKRRLVLIDGMSAPYYGDPEFYGGCTSGQKLGLLASTAFLRSSMDSSLMHAAMVGNNAIRQYRPFKANIDLDQGYPSAKLPGASFVMIEVNTVAKTITGWQAGDTVAFWRYNNTRDIGYTFDVGAYAYEGHVEQRVHVIRAQHPNRREFWQAWIPEWKDLKQRHFNARTGHPFDHACLNGDPGLWNACGAPLGVSITGPMTLILLTDGALRGLDTCQGNMPWIVKDTFACWDRAGLAGIFDRTVAAQEGTLRRGHLDHLAEATVVVVEITP